MSLSPSDRAKAEAWYVSLKERETVHVLTSDIVSPMAPHRDKRERPRWFEDAEPIKAGTRFVVTYTAPDSDHRDHFDKVLALATKLGDVRLKFHVIVRRAGRDAELRWLTVQSPVSEMQEFQFDCEVERYTAGLNKREAAYLFAQRDFARLLLKTLSNNPTEDLDALFALSMSKYISARTLAERLVVMGKVTVEDMRFALNGDNFPGEVDDA